MERARLSTLLGDLATPHALAAQQALDAGAHFAFQAAADPAGYFVSLWELRIQMVAENGEVLRGLDEALTALTAYIPDTSAAA
ncbi:hypothetical protein [Yinghuangia seranimata]|uniref:hypothetical protein n=1 Tax=Yinghuangia seranimata TaxID=408067 RepID=UPI00248C9F44|nr:hypothetical protein [Yinghuangia seranimata]MDI2127617.1 hypothetical protein [Yinghuangia seranimata]